MRAVELPGTKRVTTQLGFGCSYILPENTTLLDAAYDAGIRHFDVARSYGRGLSEKCVGEFLTRHKSDVTVTTKYGLYYPAAEGIYPFLRSIGRPIAKRMRGAARISGAVTAAVGAGPTKGKFTAREARLSLERSLRTLRSESIDIFLMHEATAEDLTDEGLLRFLENSVSAGRIGSFGVGGSNERVDLLYSQNRPYCDVLQFDWTPLEPVIMRNGVFNIVYRIFRHGRRGLAKWIDEMPETKVRWSERIGFDIVNIDDLEKLLLKAAVELRPTDLVLFSSADPKHIFRNVEVVNDEALRAPALSLAKLLLTEVQPLAL
ncbi:MAG: aldo/keto reductase [Pseudolabrys sp.]|nr:aldo/keto reductase [Pseudolabrys sp.]MDP2296027.1 aldo/keto reductase [Pseudolabrys sp.]